MNYIYTDFQQTDLIRLHSVLAKIIAADDQQFNVFNNAVYLDMFILNFVFGIVKMMEVCMSILESLKCPWQSIHRQDN